MQSLQIPCELSLLSCMLRFPCILFPVALCYDLRAFYKWASQDIDSPPRYWRSCSSGVVISSSPFACCFLSRSSVVNCVEIDIFLVWAINCFLYVSRNFSLCSTFSLRCLRHWLVQVLIRYLDYLGSLSTLWTVQSCDSHVLVRLGFVLVGLGRLVRGVWAWLVGAGDVWVVKFVTVRWKARSEGDRVFHWPDGVE